MDGIIPLVFFILLLAALVNFAALMFGLYLSFSEAKVTAKHFHVFTDFSVFTLILAVVSAGFSATGIGLIPFVIFATLIPLWLLVCGRVSKKAKIVHLK